MQISGIYVFRPIVALLIQNFSYQTLQDICR
jgi:hypothetical protein